MMQPTDSSIAQSEPVAPLRGVEHAGVIDALQTEAATGEVTLVMVEPRPWDGSELRLFQLQEKFNAYLSFALDGEMEELYPNLAGKPLRLLLKCATDPDSMTRHLLGLVHDQIAFQGIKLEVLIGSVAVQAGSSPTTLKTGGSGGCGSGCGCAGPA